MYPDFRIKDILIYLFAEDCDRITSKTSDHHGPEVGNVRALPEGRNTSSNPVPGLQHHDLHPERLQLLRGREPRYTRPDDDNLALGRVAGGGGDLLVDTKVDVSMPFQEGVHSGH